MEAGPIKPLGPYEKLVAFVVDLTLRSEPNRDQATVFPKGRRGESSINSQPKPGQIGAYWLSKKPGRDGTTDAWCRTWYDSGKRQTCRVSLGTADFHEASLALASWVVENGKGDGETSPDQRSRNRGDGSDPTRLPKTGMGLRIMRHRAHATADDGSARVRLCKRITRSRQSSAYARMAGQRQHKDFAICGEVASRTLSLDCGDPALAHRVSMGVLE
jgi:hypothetical protein